MLLFLLEKHVRDVLGQLIHDFVEVLSTRGEVRLLVVEDQAAGNAPRRSVLMVQLATDGHTTDLRDTFLEIFRKKIDRRCTTLGVDGFLFGHVFLSWVSLGV